MSICISGGGWSGGGGGGCSIVFVTVEDSYLFSFLDVNPGNVNLPGLLNNVGGTDDGGGGGGGGVVVFILHDKWKGVLVK